MSANAHIDALKKKHAEMSSHISELQKSPGTDDLKIQHLKRKKLALKDKMHSMSG